MPDTEPHRRETSDNQRPDGRGRVPRNFDSAFPARNYLSPLLPPGGAEGIRLAESSVNPAGLRLKRHMDKLAPRFRRRSPARSSFRFSARRSDCTLWLCRRLCGVELCGARQDSGRGGSGPRGAKTLQCCHRMCGVQQGINFGPRSAMAPQSPDRM